MSKTFRRKQTRDDLRWVLREYVHRAPDRSIHPHSKEGKKLLARYHADMGTNLWREPGPSWFRNITVQRPLRREGSRQLKKYLLNPETEVILDAKPPLVYWS
jgi:hypothetical protein